jgi:hypothetical protein
MASQNIDQIAQALHASRVVVLPTLNPHGPLGLGHLAEIVRHRIVGEPAATQRVERPIALPRSG